METSKFIHELFQKDYKASEAALITRNLFDEFAEKAKNEVK